MLSFQTSRGRKVAPGSTKTLKRQRRFRKFLTTSISFHATKRVEEGVEGGRRIVEMNVERAQESEQRVCQTRESMSRE